jgi:CRISPR-associated protein Csm3
MEATQAVLKGKLKISGILRIETGIHIGAGEDFAPIGSVDSPFIRDVITQAPIIPGSSIKGKLRTLLAKNRANGYVLNDVKEDDGTIKRLFAEKSKAARLQFYDLFMTNDSKNFIENLDTDTYLGEVKFENTILRLSGKANPRQIERVPAGSEFDFKLVYNIESEAAEVMEDMKVLGEGLELLGIDYLGGHGSRGYGRVSFKQITVEEVLSTTPTLDCKAIANLLHQ